MAEASGGRVARGQQYGVEPAALDGVGAERTGECFARLPRTPPTECLVTLRVGSDEAEIAYMFGCDPVGYRVNRSTGEVLMVVREADLRDLRVPPSEMEMR